MLPCAFWLASTSASLSPVPPWSTPQRLLWLRGFPRPRTPFNPLPTAHTLTHTHTHTQEAVLSFSPSPPSLRANQSGAPKESLGTTTAIGTVPSHLMGQSNSWGLTQDPKLPPSGALFPPENNQINTECSEYTLVLS